MPSVAARRSGRRSRTRGSWVPLTTTACRRCMGKYKVPHFDAKGEADAVLHGPGVPTTFLLTSFYWDNFIYFGMGPERGADGDARVSRCRWATRSCPASRPRTSAAAPTASSSAARSTIGKTVGIAGEHLTGGEMAAGAVRGARRARCATTRSPPAAYRALRFPRRRRPRQHVPVQRATSTTSSAARAAWTSRAS